MKIFLCISLVGIVTTGYCQDTDTFQPDSIYVKNNVKSRKETMVGQVSKAATIIDYDKLGRRVKYTLTDNATGERSQMDVYFFYDLKGRLSTETTYYDDSTVSKTTHFYDRHNRVIKKMTTIGKAIVEIDHITYTPRKVVRGIYFDENGRIYKTDTSFYTKENLYDRYCGFEIRDGAKHTWTYHLKASFDTVGRLISNVYISNGKEGYGDYYFYDEKGLLIKHLSGTPDAMLTKKFEYTFWD